MTSLSEDDKQWIREEISRQLAVARDNSQALVPVTSGQIVEMVRESSQAVFDSLVSYVDEKVVPRMDRIDSIIDYKLEDGEGYVDAFRRAVEKRANPDIKLITDGRKDPRIISAEVRTFFSDNSDSESD